MGIFLHPYISYTLPMLPLQEMKTTLSPPSYNDKVIFNNSPDDYWNRAWNTPPHHGNAKDVISSSKNMQQSGSRTRQLSVAGSIRTEPETVLLQFEHDPSDEESNGWTPPNSQRPSQINSSYVPTLPVVHTTASQLPYGDDSHLNGDEGDDRDTNLDRVFISKIGLHGFASSTKNETAVDNAVKYPVDECGSSQREGYGSQSKAKPCLESPLTSLFLTKPSHGEECIYKDNDVNLRPEDTPGNHHSEGDVVVDGENSQHPRSLHATPHRSSLCLSPCLFRTPEKVLRQRKPISTPEYEMSGIDREKRWERDATQEAVTCSTQNPVAPDVSPVVGTVGIIACSSAHNEIEKASHSCPERFSPIACNANDGHVMPEHDSPIKLKSLVPEKTEIGSISSAIFYKSTAPSGEMLISLHANSADKTTNELQGQKQQQGQQDGLPIAIPSNTDVPSCAPVALIVSCDSSPAQCPPPSHCQTSPKVISPRLSQKLSSVQTSPLISTGTTTAPPTPAIHQAPTVASTPRTLDAGLPWVSLAVALQAASAGNDLNNNNDLASPARPNSDTTALSRPTFSVSSAQLRRAVSFTGVSAPHSSAPPILSLKSTNLAPALVTADIIGDTIKTDASTSYVHLPLARSYSAPKRCENILTKTENMNISNTFSTRNASRTHPPISAVCDPPITTTTAVVQIADPISDHTHDVIASCSSQTAMNESIVMKNLECNETSSFPITTVNGNISGASNKGDSFEEVGEVAQSDHAVSAVAQSLPPEQSFQSSVGQEISLSEDMVSDHHSLHKSSLYDKLLLEGRDITSISDQTHGNNGNAPASDAALLSGESDGNNNSFASKSNKHISLKEKSAMLKEELLDSFNSMESVPRALDLSKFSGFQTARGSSISISAKALQRAQRMAAEDFLRPVISDVGNTVNLSNLPQQHPSQSGENGFTLSTLETPQSIATSKLREPSPSFQGFSTASGCKITLSAKALQKGKAFVAEMLKKEQIAGIHLQGISSSDENEAQTCFSLTNRINTNNVDNINSDFEKSLPGIVKTASSEHIDSKIVQSSVSHTPFIPPLTPSSNIKTRVSTAACIDTATTCGSEARPPPTMGFQMANGSSVVISQAALDRAHAMLATGIDESTSSVSSIREMADKQRKISAARFSTDSSRPTERTSGNDSCIPSTNERELSAGDDNGPQRQQILRSVQQQRQQPYPQQSNFVSPYASPTSFFRGRGANSNKPGSLQAPSPMQENIRRGIGRGRFLEPVPMPSFESNLGNNSSIFARPADVSATASRGPTPYKPPRSVARTPYRPTEPSTNFNTTPTPGSNSGTFAAPIIPSPNSAKLPSSNAELRSYTSPYVTGAVVGIGSHSAVHTPSSTSSLHTASSAQSTNTVAPNQWSISTLLSAHLPTVVRLRSCVSLEEAIMLGVPIDVCLVNTSNAASFQFVGERATMMGSSVHNMNELVDVFLQLAEVRNTSISKQWVENQFVWIVWKLASLERRYPQKYHMQLNATSVLQALGKRFTREWSKGQRSCLRRIVEQDDPAGALIVLCVADTGDASACANAGTAIITVTDGWYSVRAALDPHLTALLRNGKIFVGQKLAVCGAELCSPGPTSPLEASTSTYLKLFINGTRRARADARLGFQSRRAMLLPIRTIYPDGGNVNMLDVVILRRLPMIYMETLPDGRRVYRSQRAEDMANRLWQQQRDSHAEKIRARLADSVLQVSGSCGQGKPLGISNQSPAKALQQPLQQNTVKRARLSLSPAQIATLTTGESLYAAIKNANDPEALEASLTSEQAETLTRHAAAVNDSQIAAFKMRFESDMRGSLSEMQAREVTNLMRIVVCDYRVKKDCDLNGKMDRSGIDDDATYTANISIWRPSEDLESLLGEGKRVRIFGLQTPRTLNGFAIQLSSNKQTQFVPMPLPSPCALYTPRHAHSIADASALPPFRFIDIVVAILQVTSRTSVAADSTSQDALVVDNEGDVMLLQFWGGLDRFALSNIVLPGAVLAFINVTTKPLDRIHQTPVCMVTEQTIVSSSPKQEYLQSSLECLQRQVALNNGEWLNDVMSRYNNRGVYLARNMSLLSSAGVCEDGGIGGSITPTSTPRAPASSISNIEGSVSGVYDNASPSAYPLNVATIPPTAACAINSGPNLISPPPNSTIQTAQSMSPAQMASVKSLGSSFKPAPFQPPRSVGFNHRIGASPKPRPREILTYFSPYPFRVVELKAGEGRCIVMTAVTGGIFSLCSTPRSEHATPAQVSHISSSESVDQTENCKFKELVMDMAANAVSAGMSSSKDIFNSPFGISDVWKGNGVVDDTEKKSVADVHSRATSNLALPFAMTPNSASSNSRCVAAETTAATIPPAPTGIDSTVGVNGFVNASAADPIEMECPVCQIVIQDDIARALHVNMCLDEMQMSQERRGSLRKRSMGPSPSPPSSRRRRGVRWTPPFRKSPSSINAIDVGNGGEDSVLKIKHVLKNELSSCPSFESIASVANGGQTWECPAHCLTPLTIPASLHNPQPAFVGSVEDCMKRQMVTLGETAFIETLDTLLASNKDLKEWWQDLISSHCVAEVGTGSISRARQNQRLCRSDDATLGAQLLEMVSRTMLVPPEVIRDLPVKVRKEKELKIEDFF